MSSITWETERNCEHCKKPFTLIYKPQKCCSRSCSMTIRGQLRTEAGTYTTSCTWCHKQFSKRLSQKGKTGDFCSIECGQAFKRGNEEQFIEKQCPVCEKQYQCLFRRQTKFCSRSCGKSGENHHFFGKEGPTKGKAPWTKGLTKETDERIALIADKVSKTHKEQFESGLRSNAGENNPNHPNKRKQKERTEEQLENYSKASIERIKSFKILPWSCSKKGKYFSNKMNEEFYYRSSYEERIMKILEQDKTVIHYKHEPFYIKIATGKRYLPDFLIYYSDGTKKLIEAKPKFQFNNENVLLKKEAAEKYCKENNMIFEMWDLEKIIQLELINNNINFNEIAKEAEKALNIAENKRWPQHN